MQTAGYEMLGARTTIVQTSLSPGNDLVLSLDECGVPHDAQVLEINYTPQSDGGLFPLERHGNQVIRHTIPRRIVLHPVPFYRGANSGETERAPPGVTKLGISITWHRPTDQHLGWSHLLDAFRAFAQGRLESVVLPANIAVEMSLTPFLAAALEQRGFSKKRVEEFLKDGATYSYQLDIVLPLLCQLNGFTMLSQEVRGKLSRLRSLRNEIAHSGSLKKPLAKIEAAEVLTAALFAYHYVRWLTPNLTSAAPHR